MPDAHSPTNDHRNTGPPSGDHLVKGADETVAVVSDVPERQAVTGHNVRYVLLGGLTGAVIGLAAVLLMR